MYANIPNWMLIYLSNYIVSQIKKEIAAIDYRSELINLIFYSFELVSRCRDPLCG